MLTNSSHDPEDANMVEKAPNSNIQAPENNQAPTFKPLPFGDSLELGCWCLVLLTGISPFLTDLPP
jgi:hypothetical protein